MARHPFLGLSRNPNKYTSAEFRQLIEWSLGETDPTEDRAEEQSLVDWMYELVSELEDVAHFESGNLPPRPPPEHHELHTDVSADEAIIRRLK